MSSSSSVPRPRSFRTQVAVALGALFVVLAVALSLAFGDMLASQIRRSVGENLQRTAANAATLLAHGLHDMSREVRVLADAGRLWEGGLASAEISAQLARSQAMHPHNLWIGVADADGVVQAATNGMLVGRNVKERPWFGAGLKGSFVGDVHAAKLLASLLPPMTSGEPQRFVDFAAPIRRDGRVVAVLGVHGSWDWTRDVIESLLPPGAAESGVAVYIFDAAGKPIYAAGGPVDALAASGQLAPTVAADGKAPAAVVTWRDGREYLTANVRLRALDAVSDLGWQVVVRQPVDTAYAPIRPVAQRALVIGLFAALAAVLVAWGVAGRVCRPLSTLAEAARDVERAAARASIPVLHDSSEVHSLSLTLNGMTRRLIESNERMEQQVLARTQELRRANAELDTQARSDPLTGLLNRRGFDAHLRIALASARRRNSPLSVVMIDVDHFKRINDRHGHDVGDQVLVQLATLLTGRLRDSDIVARFGGEEFVMLLPDTDRGGAQHVAEELVRAVATQPMAAVGNITVSAGVAATGAEPPDAKRLLRQADEALYSAKGAGRNRVCLYGEGAALAA